MTCVLRTHDIKQTNVVSKRPRKARRKARAITIHHVNAASRRKQRCMTECPRRGHKRKQIPVCRNCHNKIYTGKYDGTKIT
jgi:hypothetical protein